MKELFSQGCAPSPKKHTSIDSLMRYAELLGYGNLHLKVDKKTGLRAIIAVHNLSRGPAIGGCRMVPYESMDKAIEDALRLGYMMSYKSAINDLPHGGAKAVILKPAHIDNRQAFFEKFGDFVHEIGGRYLTAVDSGTSPAEMDIIATRTPYVTCTSQDDSVKDPSPLTALGVRRGIEAAIHFKFGDASLEGKHITIQGLGHVGYPLAKDLHRMGAKLTVADLDSAAVKRCVEEFGAKPCHPNDIFDIEADVFAPCALGAILTRQNINRLKVKVIAGGANNQLAHAHYGELLREKGIVYAPDFLINAGGVILVAYNYAKRPFEESVAKINQIYDRAYEIFERAKKEQRATNLIAQDIARERLK